MATALWKTWVGSVTCNRDKVLALIDGASGASLARGELLARSVQFADALGPTLAGGKKIVAFAEKNSFRWLTIFLALQREDAIALPLDSALPEAQQVTMAADLGAHFLLRSNDSLHALPTPVELFEGEKTTAAEAAEICLFKLTSGTTGQPKALPCTSANMLADGRQVCATMNIRPEDLNLGAIPFGHSYGLGNLVLPLICQGTPVVCSQEMLPAALATQIARFGVTVFPTVPVVLRALAESEVNPRLPATLRRIISAGAPLRPEVAQAFARRFGGLRAHNFYGSSETGGICFDRDGEATLTGRALGTPLEGVEVRLNAEGRVVVRSAAVAGASGEHVLPDLGEWNERGELRLIGRAATAVANIGGKKVDPAEVERTLRALAGVSDAWVGVRTRATGSDDFLFAAVETNSGREEILRELAARLPAWQIPRRIFTAARLPRNERGKLDRAALEGQLEPTTAVAENSRFQTPGSKESEQKI